VLPDLRCRFHHKTFLNYQVVTIEYVDHFDSLLFRFLIGDMTSIWEKMVMVSFLSSCPVIHFEGNSPQKALVRISAQAETGIRNKPNMN